MKKLNRLWREIAAGGLSLALVGGFGLPMTARAAENNSSGNICKMVEHRQAMRALHEKMLAKAKAEDAALERLVAELKKAPEAKKVDLEAAILTKLVAEHHQRLGEWESMHAQMMKFRKERMQTALNRTAGGCMGKGMMGQGTSTAQK